MKNVGIEVRRRTSGARGGQLVAQRHVAWFLTFFLDFTMVAWFFLDFTMVAWFA